MRRDTRARYIGNLPLFIRAQTAEVADLDPGYAAACADIAATVYLGDPNKAPCALSPWSYRAAVYATLHCTCGLS